MKKLVPYMFITDEKKRNIISSFCRYVSENKYNLDESKKRLVSEFIITLVVGKNIDSINKGIYNMLSDYLMQNIDTLEFSYFGSSIRKIKLGDIDSGAVFPYSLSNEEISNRFMKSRQSYGVIPTKDNMERLFLNYHGFTYFSDDIYYSEEDSNNVHIGDYYFNINNILNSSPDPYIIKLSMPYDKQLQEDVISFDKSGNVEDIDIYINYVEEIDNRRFKVVKQIHNQLENIDDCRRKK